MFVNGLLLGKYLNNPDYDKVKSIYEFRALNLKGEVIQLEKYRGFVCLIVNVVSISSFTGENYKALNKLYDKYESQGLRILAFPCNQFQNKEPGSPEEIEKFVKERGVRFDMFGKVRVNGEKAHPLFRYIKKHLKGMQLIREPFTKFLINRCGRPVLRFEPETLAMALTPDIERHLKSQPREYIQIDHL